MTPESRRPRVILQADDFGRDAATTRAILRCVEHGTITSFTVMTNMPASEDALAAARALDRRVSVGVHLNLCEGRPLTPARTLVSARGEFVSRRAVIRRAATRRLDPAAIEAELTAQVARAQNARIAVSHLDSHKHLHVLPGISRIVAAVARRFDIRHVRCPARPLAGGVGRLATRGSLFFRTLAARGARRHFAAAGLASPQGFVDLRQLVAWPAAIDAARVRDMLGRGGECVEVMCHPAADGGDTEILLSEQFRSALTGASARTCTYWEC